MNQSTNLQCSGSEFNPNGRLGLQAKLVPGKPGKDIGFSDPRVADQYDLEEVVVFMVHFVRHMICLLSNTQHHQLHQT